MIEAIEPFQGGVFDRINFIELFEREAGKAEDARWLAQGTIYSAVIESAATGPGKVRVNKSHHSVGALPGYMRL